MQFPACAQSQHRLVGLKAAVKIKRPVKTTRFIFKKTMYAWRLLSSGVWCGVDTQLVRLRWNVMEHAQKPDFVFRRNGRVHLNRQWRQFSRLLAAEVCASAVVLLDTPSSEVVWRVLTTYSIHQFPLHFPSLTSPGRFNWTIPRHVTSQPRRTDVGELSREARIYLKIVLLKCNEHSETLGSPDFLHCLLIWITLHLTSYFIQRLIIL